MSVKLGNTNISSILGSSGASSGTTDYTDLVNKPSINGISLVGNKTASDLGITLSTDNFYTKEETNNKINTDVTTAVQPKADKTYVDTQLNLKVSNSDFNNSLALKADKSNTYTKTETNAEIDSAIATKADISYVNTALDSKVSINDIYDKDEIDTQLDILENSIDNKLANKSDKTTTYTKTEADAAISTALADRATISYVDTGLATKADADTTYTKTEVDDLIVNTGPIGDTLPVGSIVTYSGQTTPNNWLLCDGREVSRTVYSQLFNVIGTMYGPGDGSTSFNLPTLTSSSQNYIIKAKQSSGVVATVIDTLTNTSAVDALSANQGRLLNNNLQTLNNKVTSISTKLTKLWENKNKSGLFSAQTITLSSKDYDYLKIFYKGSYSQSTLLSTDTLKGYGFTLNFASDARTGSGSNAYYGATMTRLCTRQSDVKFSIPSATVKLGNSTTVNTDDKNAYCVPIAIYGGKF